ncbi:EAL domain-containing protein [Blastochloris viridis]|uniref:Diguanylate cyclase/phosphodiesterase with PAS/PAC sensor n=2 Tax=Blastochloris viridis TaxID=1079 RepID=A0A182D0I2_BLAVI|nr:EAL domain-containing protein [Blastochloris viridis]ALK07893.1 Cyclic di-GMP phosphodiesterase Gmr [Blastochloris viridis]BAR98858.1 diguanylate cyclase/phosphodiesterase with PAS/PAC sensor [Blastochloris viridis]
MRVIRAALMVVALFAGLASHSAEALDAVAVRQNVPAIDLLPAAEQHRVEGDRIQVSTAPGPDGIVRRIEVRAREPGTTSNWLVFALANNTDEQLDRLVVAPHFRMVGSGLVWPDLGSIRIVSLTPSQGFRPEQQNDPGSDTFLVTLDPGATVTLVAELRTPQVPQLYLWEPEAYKAKVNSFTLYYGIVIGIAGLLALFLTILFVVKGSVMFPAAALLGWAVLAQIGTTFGFWARVFDLSTETQQIWRAGGEAILAATLVVFLFAYLNLSRWHVRYGHIAIGWLVFLGALIGLAVVDPPMAAGIARMSILAVAVLGFCLIVYLSTHGFDRAVLLIPTWTLLLIWVITSGFTISGAFLNELVAPALLGGLVLIVMLIGFTVMQHAFAGGGLAGAVSDIERRALAIAGSGDIVWDWDVGRDAIFTSPEAEQLLGLKRGSLETDAAGWLETLHPSDRDRFRTALDSVVDQRRGRIAQQLRLRSQDGHYMWFSLRARPVIGSDGEVVRCIGTMVDITENKTAEERLLHDAVHDNLTGLPNRALFLDRMDAALGFARIDETMRPAVILLDIDRFKQVNLSAGVSIGDSILLTIARRLTRLLKPQDTLARLSGDQYGIILLSEREPERITAFADTIRKTLRTPITFANREIFLTASIGLALVDAEHGRREEVLKDAELAMQVAKRIGGDRIEVFKPALRAQKPDRLGIESDLRRAIERDEIAILYQPIVRLEDRTVAGFEALARWNHPRLGKLAPAEFIPIAEETGLIVDLGLFVMDRAARQLGAWQRVLRLDPPIFVSVNVSSRQLLRHDLIQDVKGVLARNVVIPDTLKLELTESLVMANPEYAAQMLSRIRDLGAGLSLDDFGTGHSSLAYLQRFPFDTIKIDQQFVRPSASGARPVLLRSIVAMAHDLGMEVVAEGAETEADTIELARLGCEYVQGFVFGEPLTAEEARRLIAPVPAEGQRAAAGR